MQWNDFILLTFTNQIICLHLDNPVFVIKRQIVKCFTAPHHIMKLIRELWSCRFSINHHSWVIRSSVALVCLHMLVTYSVLYGVFTWSQLWVFVKFGRQASSFLQQPCSHSPLTWSNLDKSCISSPASWILMWSGRRQTGLKYTESVPPAPTETLRIDLNKDLSSERVLQRLTSE